MKEQAPEPDAAHARVGEREGGDAEGSSSAFDHVLALQRAAGNSAVNHILGVRSDRHVQRHTSLEPEYEPGSVQRALLGGGVTVQRHTSLEPEFEPDSVQRQADPGAVRIQRDLIDDLNDAMDGWGTDEDAMRSAIRTASAADKRAALRDPRLVRRMADELTRSEMREMLNGLGAPLTMRLEASMAGWGADSDEILAMCRHPRGSSRRRPLAADRRRADRPARRC